MQERNTGVSPLRRQRTPPPVEMTDAGVARSLERGGVSCLSTLGPISEARARSLLLDFAAAEVIDDDAEVVELADGDFHVAANGGFG